MRLVSGVAMSILVAGSLSAQSPLAQPVSLAVHDAPLVEALLILRRERRVPLAWRGDQLPPRHRVTIDRVNAPLSEVLAELLKGTLLTARVTMSGTVVLSPGSDSALPSTLATGIQELDQLLVVGSAVAPLPAREQPTAVTVVTEHDLAASPHRRLADQIRAFLPGVLIWDRGGIGPAPTLGGVRGVSSFTARAPKVYVDGIELASPELFTLLDGRTIARMEMIQGPQGAALYGPDALGGVIEITTKKGSAGTSSKQLELAAVSGVLDRDLGPTAVWREAALGGELGQEHSSTFILGSVTRLGAADEGTQQLGLQGAGRVHLGNLVAEFSGRVGKREAPIERVNLAGNRLSLRSGLPIEERGAGIRLVHTTSSRFSQSLVAGVHRVSGSREPFRSPILPPRLPGGATNETAERKSIRYSATVDLDRVSFSAGAEASERDIERSLRDNLEFGGISSISDQSLDSRGIFAQTRFRFGALNISGGGRVDRVNTVGTASNSPWSATAGASYTVPVGINTLRIRGAWGRALRPPEPGMAQALAIGTIHQDSNSLLESERQSGVEFGLDIYLARGAWFRATWFNQRANNLVQQVDLRRPDNNIQFYQFQNVGAITNRGWEVDGGVAAGPFSAAVRFNSVSSKIVQLSPTYTGEFQVGDKPLEVPTLSGSAALRWERNDARIEVGASWIGPWVGYDWLLVARAEAGQTPLRDRAREYWLEYQGVVRPFVGVQLPIGGAMALWARGEMPLGSDVNLRDNLSPPLGRTLLVGLEVR